MRREFFAYLYELMKQNPNIIALTGDLGYGGFDRIRDELPAQFINTGAAEQAMMDIAVGLAYSGKIPVCYSITPFLLYRPYETWRTYINHERLHVIGIGSGRDDDYKHDGYSHFAGDDKIMLQLEYLSSWWPADMETMKAILSNAIEMKVPTYINLQR